LRLENRSFTFFRVPESLNGFDDEEKCLMEILRNRAGAESVFISS